MSKKKKDNNNPDVHNELKGFEIKINEFGEIVSSYDVDKLNDFLDEQVEDKKLKDLDVKREKDEE